MASARTIDRGVVKLGKGTLHVVGKVSATIDPANLVDAAGVTLTAITVPGAQLGDFVLPSTSVDLVGITCTAYVEAADTVRIRLQNESGSAADLASSTWKVLVLR